MLDTSDIVRSNFLSKKLKSLLEQKGMTIQEVADKLGNSHAYISANLSGKKVPSDNFFVKVGNAIGLTENQMKEIFKEADLEKYKYKYGEDPKVDPLGDVDFDFDIALRKEYGQELDDYTIEKIKDFIEHVKFLKKNDKNK